MPFLKRCFLSAAILLSLTGIGSRANAAEGLQLQEQQIKAGLLYNFLKYTDWPPDSFANGNTIIICIFGDDPFGGNLNPIKGRTVNQREIDVRQVRDVQGTTGCDLLFINQDEKAQWPALRSALAGKNILTVSDFDSFATEGGMIEFGHRNDHVSATLNVNALNRAGLRVEERLLRLVTVVHGDQP